MNPLALTATLAIILGSTGDPDAHTLAPPFAPLAWSWVGFFGPFTGVAIGPHTFVAATHIGGAPGQLFLYQGHYYPTLSATPAPDGSDFTLWRVGGEVLTNYAPLYPGPAIGKLTLLAGRGTRRGPAQWVYSNDPLTPLPRFPSCQALAGWSWGPWDGRLRWGTNTLGGSLARYSCSFTPSTCTASLGDSSGACFALDPRDGVWKLVGVISYVWVTGPYATSPGGPATSGAFTSTRWLYTNGEQEPTGYASQTFITPLTPLRWWVESQAR